MEKTDKITEGKIKALLLKGFSKEEISKILDINISDIKIELDRDIEKSSADLYNELQKDLAGLISRESKKSNSDSSVILNAIKLTAELQDKKLRLGQGKKIDEKIDKDYIYKRDEEISKLIKTTSEEDIAKKFKISILSVRQSLDRYNLKLPEELSGLSPSIISETIGLDRDTRLKILKDVKDNSLNRKEVRSMVIKIKNKTR